MLTSDEFRRVAPAFPFLRDADPRLIRDFQQEASVRLMAAGREVFVQGGPVEAIPLLLSGLVRVYQISESGREVTLYRFRPGESCVLTANAVLGRKTFPAIATVEEEGEAVMIPADVFRGWVESYPAWRDFYFDHAPVVFVR
jgi:CRP/FNR family transcriptional regulator